MHECGCACECKYKQDAKTERTEIVEILEKNKLPNICLKWYQNHAQSTSREAQRLSQEQASTQTPPPAQL